MSTLVLQSTMFYEFFFYSKTTFQFQGGQDTEKDETNTKSNENEAMSKVAETNQAEKCKTTKKSSKKNKTDVLDANGEVSRKGKKRKLKDAEESDSDRQKNKTKKQRGKGQSDEVDTKHSRIPYQEH